MTTFPLTSSIEPKSIRLMTLGGGDSNKLATKSNDQKIRDAAQGFERALIRQLLSVARSTNLRGGEQINSTSAGYLEIMDDKLAEQISKGQGLGFATKMAEQLTRQIKAKELNDNAEKSVTIKPSGEITTINLGN
jgi:Rod binding domain-containing protein